MHHPDRLYSNILCGNFLLSNILCENIVSWNTCLQNIIAWYISWEKVVSQNIIGVYWWMRCMNHVSLATFILWAPCLWYILYGSMYYNGSRNDPPGVRVVRWIVQPDLCPLRHLCAFTAQALPVSTFLVPHILAVPSPDSRVGKEKMKTGEVAATKMSVGVFCLARWQVSEVTWLMRCKETTSWIAWRIILHHIYLGCPPG